MKTYQMFKKRLSFPLTLILSSAFKTLILYFSVLIYFRLHLVPKLFLVSMGMIQLVTALLGGILAYALLEFVKRKYERSVST